MGFLEVWQFLNQHSGAVSAIAGIMSFLVTVIYTSLTYKLLHNSSLAHLRPTGFSFEDFRGMKIKIKNFGPGLAKNIQVKAVVLGRDVTPIPNTQPLKVIYETKRSIAIGPYEIAAGQECEYELEGLPGSNPLVISWETVTGKRQGGKWLLDKTIDGDIIKPAGQLTWLRFRVRWLRTVMLSTYYSWLKRRLKRKGVNSALITDDGATTKELE